MNLLRWFYLFISTSILVAVYLFQHFPLAGHVERIIDTSFSENLEFIINKTARVLINDNAAILFIYALFLRRDYVRLAFGIQFFELFILLPLYFLFKLSLEGTSEISSPILAQFHRLIVNPTLMILLIFGLFYQKYYYNKMKG